MPDSENAAPMPVAVPMQRDYLAVIFRRCVLALIGSRVPENTSFERGMLEELVMFAEQYLSELAQHLARVCAIQRRTSPATADLALLLHLNQLNIVDLEQEAKLKTQIEESHPVNTLNALYFDPNEADIPAESQPFFEHPHQLVASSRQKPSYIPNWMPPLPADHTYMHTESHSSLVRDLREVRVSLVEEGRLAERALQRLLGDKGSSSIIDLKRPELAVTKKMVTIDTDESIDDMVRMEETVSAGVPAGEEAQNDNLASENISENHNDKEEADPAHPTANVPAGEEAADESVDRPKPLKIRLHAPHAESRDEPKADEDDAPQKLSLKFALRKPKKTKEVSVLGKRPRSLNIVKLAKKQLSETSRNPAPSNDSEEPETNSFQAALASFVR